MNQADLCCINNEFTLSDRGEKLAGKAYTFRAKPQNVSYLKEMGADLVTLANNHIYDYGKDAFNDTLDNLSKLSRVWLTDAGNNDLNALEQKLAEAGMKERPLGVFTNNLDAGQTVCQAVLK